MLNAVSATWATVIGKRFLPNGPFLAFSMILKFSMGHFLSFYTDFYGPFSKLMGLWRMAPCLPNHWGYITVPHFSRLLRHAWGYGGHILDLSPRVPMGALSLIAREILGVS